MNGPEAESLDLSIRRARGSSAAVRCCRNCATWAPRTARSRPYSQRRSGDAATSPPRADVSWRGRSTPTLAPSTSGRLRLFPLAASRLSQSRVSRMPSISITCQRRSCAPGSGRAQTRPARDGPYRAAIRHARGSGSRRERARTGRDLVTNQRSRPDRQDSRAQGHPCTNAPDQRRRASGIDFRYDAGRHIDRETLGEVAPGKRAGLILPQASPDGEDQQSVQAGDDRAERQNRRGPAPLGLPIRCATATADANQGRTCRRGTRPSWASCCE